MPPSCALLGRFAIGARVALLWQHNANPSYKLASIRRYDDIVRTLSGVCACCWPVTGGWRGAFSKLRAVYGKWTWLAGQWLAVDRGRSQNYCGGLNCRLALVAFWQHNANAKCYRVHACSRSMPRCIFCLIWVLPVLTIVVWASLVVVN